MSGWIKLDKDAINDPRLMQAAVKISTGYFLVKATAGADLAPSELLRFWCNAVTGALVTLWKYADQHIRDDNTLPIALQTVDAMVGIEGFCAALPDEWIHELDDGTSVLPGYCEKNSLITQRKSREKSNARVALWRANHKQGGNGVTHALPKRNSSVPKVVDQDQDLKKDRLAISQSPTRKRKVPRETPEPEYLEFKLAFPQRAGDPRWRGGMLAARARLREGHGWAEMIEGAKRYATFILATGKQGTEYVKTAEAFLGPGKPFLEPFALPAPKPSGRQPPPRDPAAEALEAARSLGFKARPDEAQADFLARFDVWNAKRIRALPR